MLKIKSSVAGAVLDEIKKAAPQTELDAGEVAAMLEYPPDPSMGDLALPCFKLSKIMRRSPVQIAEAIATGLSSPCLKKAEAVNGYLNMYISDACLSSDVLEKALEKGDKYGAPSFGAGKTVVLDYSSPNVAKPFHIGHLGTTVIGHSLKKLHQFAGYKCIGINYLGDWGTQFGKLIVAYRKWGSMDEIEKGGVDKLVELYVKFHNEAENDKTLEDEARAEFTKLEHGDKENHELWRKFVDISLREYEKTYKLLGIDFDSYKGESFYTDKMPAQVEILREKGLLKIDDGASIVDLSAYNMPPCLILKRDGSTLYPTRDIAAAVYRKKEYNFDKAIYVTSAGQSLHFAQWFKVVELMGYDWYDELVHVPYGTVSINGEKLATRTGNVILLRDLFALAIDKVMGIINERNPDLENKEKVAEEVGVGAIIFYYLSNNRMRDINFVMEDALSFDGNTGPYVQYAYARTCSILAKEQPRDGEDKITTDEERALLKAISLFEEKVCEAIDQYEPSVIARYILDVAVAFNRFYHGCRILSEEDADIKNTRLRITKAAQTVLGSAFELICLKKTEKI